MHEVLEHRKGSYGIAHAGGSWNSASSLAPTCRPSAEHGSVNILLPVLLYDTMAALKTTRKEIENQLSLHILRTTKSTVWGESPISITQGQKKTRDKSLTVRVRQVNANQNPPEGGQSWGSRSPFMKNRRRGETKKVHTNLFTVVSCPPSKRSCPGDHGLECSNPPANNFIISEKAYQSNRINACILQ